jgi:hypothetical protein
MSAWPELDQARRLTRRKVLALAGAAGGVMVTCAGLVALPVLRRGPYGPRPTGLLVLDTIGYHVLCDVAVVILGDAADPDAVIRRVDETLATLDPLMRKLMLSYPTLLESGGFVAGGRLKPFTDLSVDEQRWVFDQWASSRLLLWRQTASALRQLITAHHYGAEAP